jgi:hypothetical protein
MLRQILTKFGPMDRRRRLGRRHRSNAIDGDGLEMFYRSKDGSEIERPPDDALVSTWHQVDGLVAPHLPASPLRASRVGPLDPGVGLCG